MGDSTSSGDDSPFTPAERRADFAKEWVQRTMGVIDRLVEKETRDSIMHECGRDCFVHAYGPPPPDAPPLDEWIAQRQVRWGPEHTYRDGDVVYFDYVQNPRGLKVSDGYCLCPIVEDGPDDLSPTFCECSVGYVTEMFRRVARRPVRVELLEAVRRGGKSCRFKVSLL